MAPADHVGTIVSGAFQPLLAKLSKSFSLVDAISVGGDRLQRNFEPMRRQVLKKGRILREKILDHRGANWGPLYPLSYVGLEHGAALAGDTAGARKAYETFFDLWKDADSDVPILIQARREYSRLAR